jgi:hypothetical protein
MSEAQTLPEPEEDAAPPAELDPSDPEAATAAVRREMADNARRAQEREAQYEQRIRNQQAQAERAVATERQRADAAVQDRATLEFSTIASALDAAERQAELIQDQLKTAVEAGDGAAVGRLSVQAGRVGAQIEQYQAAKQQLEARRNETLRSVPQQTQQPPPSQPQVFQSDPIEGRLAAMHPSDAAWIRQHRDANGGMRYYTDQTWQNRVTGAHYEAMAEGHKTQTPEYYAFVDQRLGMNNASARPQTPAPLREPEGVRSVPPPSAPVRQSGSYTDNQRRGNSDGHIPPAFVKTMADLNDLTVKDPKTGKKVPDMAAIAAAWRESREMARTRKYKEGDPWAGAR